MIFNHFRDNIFKERFTIYKTFVQIQKQTNTLMYWTRFQFLIELCKILFTQCLIQISKRLIVYRNIITNIHKLFINIWFVDRN